MVSWLPQKTIKSEDSDSNRETDLRYIGKHEIITI